MTRFTVLQILGAASGWGGAEGVALELARALKERGHEMLFAAPESEALDRVRATGFEGFAAPIRSRVPLAAAWSLAGLMRRRGVTVAHSHSRRPGIAGLPAAALAGVPIRVLHVHSLATATGSERVSRLVFRMLNRLADRTIYCSVAAREAVEAGESRHSAVIPNGVHFGPAPARGCHPGEPPLVVTIGRFSPAKGYHVLLEAAREISRQMPAVRFEIAGDGELRGELEALRSQLGLDASVRFLGFVDDLSSLLGRASVFVMPSIWEGLPLALLEAIAAGVPVVATSVGEIPRVLAEGRNGRLVQPGDPGSLAAAVLEVLRNPADAQSRADLARTEAAATYSVEAMAAAIERVYHEVSAEKGL